MSKKMMLIGLLMIVLAGGLFANGNDSKKGNSNLRKIAIEYLKENGFEEETNSKFLEIKIIPNNNMVIPYEGYKGYSIRFRGDEIVTDGSEWKSMRILLKNNTFFSPLFDFNKILRNEGIKIDSTNALKIVSDFLKLRTLYPKTLKIEKIHRVHVEIDSIWRKMGMDAFYNYEVCTYQKVNGIKKKWLIGLKNGYIFMFQFETLDFYQGDYIKKFRLSPLKKRKSPPVFLNLGLYKKDREKSIEAKNYADKIISFYYKKNPYYNYVADSLKIYYYKRNIITMNNNSATNENERRINISLSGFTANDDKQIFIYSTHGATNWIIAPEDSIYIHFDSEGAAEYTQIIPDSTKSAIYEIYLSGEGEILKDFYIYETKTQELTDSYFSFDIYEIDKIYCNFYSFPNLIWERDNILLCLEDSC